MTGGRPALIWQDVLDWAQQNRVPGDAIMQDRDGRPFRLDHVAAGRIVLAHSPAGVATWAELRQQAAAAGADGDHRLTELDGGDLYRLVDLDVGDDDGPYFILQRRWG